MPSFPLSEVSGIEGIARSSTSPPLAPQGEDPFAGGAFNEMVGGIQSFVKNTPGRRPRRAKQLRFKEQEGTADRQIFGGFWLVPKAVDAGFIVETTETDILVWNSDVENELTVTQIQEVNPAGTLLEAPTPPFQLPVNGSRTHKLTILKEGPPTQATQYIYTAGIFTQALEVIGKRVLAWNFEPNWGKRVNIGYSFQTVIYRNRRYREQRRPRIVNPLRSLKAEYLYEKEDLQKYLSDYRRLHRSFLAIPIYVEAMTPAADLQGLTDVPLVEDISDYTDINGLSSLVLIRDRLDRFEFELKTVQSVAANQITLDVPVIGDFKASRTVIFPAFVGIIKSKSPIGFDNDRVGSGNMEFEEVRTG